MDDYPHYANLPRLLTMGFITWLIKCVVCGGDKKLDLTIQSDNPSRDVCQGCRKMSEIRNADNIRSANNPKSLPNWAERMKQ